MSIVFLKKFLWYFMEKRPGDLVEYGNYGINKKSGNKCRPWIIPEF
jgi:hypothetical protein